MKRIFCSVNATILLVAVALFISACGKDGSAGPKGDTGAAGPAGPAGPQGDPGTANVIYSDWMNVAFKADTIHTAGGGIDTLGFYADIDIAKLDATLINTGEMKVYLNFNTPADPVVVALPYFNVYSNLSISATFFTGGVELYSNGDASSGTDANGNARWQYRYVLIPGGSEARKAKTLDMSDYKAVQAFLGLKN